MGHTDGHFWAWEGINPQHERWSHARSPPSCAAPSAASFEDHPATSPLITSSLPPQRLGRRSAASRVTALLWFPPWGPNGFTQTIWMEHKRWGHRWGQSPSAPSSLAPTAAPGWVAGKRASPSPPCPEMLLPEGLQQSCHLPSPRRLPTAVPTLRGLPRHDPPQPPRAGRAPAATRGCEAVSQTESHTASRPQLHALRVLSSSPGTKGTTEAASGRRAGEGNGRKEQTGQN